MRTSLVEESEQVRIKRHIEDAVFMLADCAPRLRRRIPATEFWNRRALRVWDEALLALQIACAEEQADAEEFETWSLWLLWISREAHRDMSWDIALGKACDALQLLLDAMLLRQPILVEEFCSSAIRIALQLQEA